MIWRGKAASPGVAIGRALVFQEDQLEVVKKSVEDTEYEWKRFQAALDQSKNEIEHIVASTIKSLGQDEASIFEAHLMMLQDPEVLDQTKQKLDQEKVNVEYAYQMVTHQFAETFANMEDPYFRERAQDVRDVAQRVLGHLMGVSTGSSFSKKMASLTEPVILVAKDLKPSFTASLNPKMVRGFLVDIGGRTSHTAILARNLEIPAVVGLRHFSEVIKEGELVAFNGDSGEIWINPDSNKMIELQLAMETAQNEKAALREFVGKESKTLDGHSVDLVANIGTPTDLAIINRNDAEGVGLFRTEFLFLERTSPPPEEMQYNSYKEVLHNQAGKIVIIRTLDIGADKQVPYLNLPVEENPALGYRAIRYCLDHIDLFKTQIRALLRASPFGNLGIMFPMVQSLDEILKLKSIVREVKEELESKKILVSQKIQIGVMVEVPALIFVLDKVLPHLDFVSIGTNDLIQYLCAADRMNEKVADLHDSYHPGVLAALNQIVSKTHSHNKWVGMCGDMAGQTEFLPLLLGMGIDELSMSGGNILKVRKMLRGLRYTDCQGLLQETLECANSLAVKEKLNLFKTTHFV